MDKLHFIGIAGSGVSALAQFHVMEGGRATGSDRAFDRGEAGPLREKLERLGVRIYPQDGSALDSRPAYAVASSAVEKGNKDLEAASARGIEVRHRAEELGRRAASFRAIAVAGTSGKSTTVAMIFEMLESAGLRPSVITGGNLRGLEARGLVGNAFRGGSDLLVIEADESDGSLARYRPWLGVLLNLSKDHKEIAELRRLFSEFLSNCERIAVQAGLLPWARGGLSFGVEDGEVRAENLELGPAGSSFSVSGVLVRLPVPGRHNVENAVAALAACRAAGVELEKGAEALGGFHGVARRLERVGSAGGVEVIDDFAHNPVKVSAALSAVRLRAGRVLAVFQLHGFAPARLMRGEFIEAFCRELRPGDVLWMPEIYYAGGTAAKDISAADIVRPVAAAGRDARFAPDRDRIVRETAREARPGDVILVMGARDPSLPEFARRILAAIRRPGRHSSMK